MSISEMLLPEFDQEMANTRKTLDRCPEDKFGWKPHEKSFTMGALASHIAGIPHWGALTLTQDSFDYAPVGEEPYTEPPATSREELLEKFDKSVSAMRAALTEASDDHMNQEWSLLGGGKPIFKMPRIAVIRGMILNHTIHHRAQLGVYLRLNDVPVPAVYGPTADEPGM